MNEPNAKKVSCPECDTPLVVSSTDQAGSVIECPACSTESEIITLNPLQVAPLEEEK